MALDPLFGKGILVGILGGVIGSLLVTSMYRWVDKEKKGFNGWTFIVTTISLIIIILILL